jgi:hypothetical protein
VSDGDGIVKKMHVGCWAKLNLTCIHCAETIDGQFYTLEEGKLHVECYEEWYDARAPKCVHCALAVTGKYYPVEEGRLHLECWEPFMAAAGEVDACVHCAEPVVAQYYEVDGGKLHVGCWDGHRAAIRAARKAAAEAAAAEAAAEAAEAAPAEEEEAPAVQLTGNSQLGWMYKKVEKGSDRIAGKGKARGWKRRWAAVRADCLCYYADEGCTALKGWVPLQGAQLRRRVHAGGALGEREGIELVYSVDGATHTLKAFALDDGRAGNGAASAARWLLALQPFIAQAAAAAADPTAAAQVREERGRMARASQIELGDEDDEEATEADDTSAAAAAADAPGVAGAEAPDMAFSRLGLGGDAATEAPTAAAAAARAEALPDGAARLGLFYKKVVKKGMIDALHMRPWKKRWGAVRADCLCYYADEGCTLLKGSLPLAGAQLRRCTVTNVPSSAVAPGGEADGFELIDAAAGLTLRGAPVGEFEVTGAGALMGFAERWVPQLATAIEVAADPARAAEVAEERGRMRAATQIEIGADADDDDGGDGMLPPRVPMPNVPSARKGSVIAQAARKGSTMLAAGVSSMIGRAPSSKAAAAASPGLRRGGTERALERRMRPAPAVDVPVPPLSRLSSVVYVGGGDDDDLDEGSAGKVADDPRAAMPAELVSTAM